AVYASPILFAACTTATPPWTQDSLRVGGSPLPDRDFHPARDAKLFLARERCASAAAESRSGVQRSVGWRQPAAGLGSAWFASPRRKKLVTFIWKGRPCQVVPSWRRMCSTSRCNTGILLITASHTMS